MKIVSFIRGAIFALTSFLSVAVVAPILLCMKNINFTIKSIKLKDKLIILI